MSTTSSAHIAELRNFVGGRWVRSSSAEYLDVLNPATNDVLARVPDSSSADVDLAIRSAAEAFPDWRRTPPEERIQYLFGLKALLEKYLDDIARTLVMENGKTLTEARGEIRRAIENVEVACGIPTLMQGYNLEDVARGIDEIMIRQPLGVVAAITPFNFPAMIPFWFLPYAVACGNTFILKPSERVPMTMRLTFELMEELNFPAGVLNLVNGGKDAVNALLGHRDVRAISFVGSTATARYIYSRAAESGKRVQCQGGAKNHVVIMPDAEMDTTTQIVSDSAFGCAGQRCLAVSVAVTVGEASSSFRNSIVDAAKSIKTGFGLDDGVQMGPLITKESKARVESLVSQGIADGAKVALDGRQTTQHRGNFLSPTVLDDVPGNSVLSDTEIFGPVLSLVHAKDIEEALTILSRSAYGNAASIFTTSGYNARKFRYDAPAGNIGVNIGVAAPMAYFPFSGWKDSFLGVLHGQGRDAVEFYTDKKVVVERWPREWSRKF